MQAEKDKVVSIDFTLTDSDDQVIDSSEGREPLAYLHGQGQILPKLEEAIEGKTQGEQVQITLSPEEGYGERDENLVAQVPVSQFEGVDEISPGMQFQAETEDGERIFTVVDTDGETVVVDGNHPLAGATLKFDIKLSEVREPSEEELEHGHAHGEGGHEH